MKMGRTKCTNVLSNVVCPVETEELAKKLQITKFSISVDETSDRTNEKWMTFNVRYVDPETLDIRSQVVKLINIDAKDSSAEKLFDAFKSEMWKLQIPFTNIIALSCDNASVMTGKHCSFKTKLEKMCKKLITFPCPCHSAALSAHAACAKIPSFCDDFLRKIAHYINGSPKRSAIFKEFSECFEDKHLKILKLSDTRWLSHYTCVERLLYSWKTIRYFLQEMVVSDKTKSAEDLLSMMDNVELRAYFLFLKYVLNYFNSFNAYFQSTETRIHLLQLKSVDFLSHICQNFVKKEFLKDVTTIGNFSHKDIQKDVDEIFLGSDCETYLKDLMEENHADTVMTVRQNCFEFYITAAEEIYRRLPIKNEFLQNLQVFHPAIALRSEDRETSLKNVFYISRTLGGFDEESLKEEWLQLPGDFNQSEKEIISKGNLDDTWQKILLNDTCGNKYPTLTNLVSAVRSLPNSNADPERTFSILTDLKSKKRNKLSAYSVNATCVIKSALKARGETAISMKVTDKHLSRMSSHILYRTNCKKEKSKLFLYAADEVAGPSSSTH